MRHVQVIPYGWISIHALRKESDLRRVSVWLPVIISIHALRKESDLSVTGQQRVFEDFNPRSP